MKKRILYIAGAPHCGSTMLDIMLGDVSGVCSTGELENICLVDQDTGGQNLSDSPLWGKVLADPGMPETKRLQYFAALDKQERGFIKLLRSETLCQQYSETYDRVFDAIFRTTGAETIIDSSKYMTRALALLRGSRYDIRVLHLVRDPRGFINSLNWRRKEQGRPLEYTYGMYKWLLKNTAGSVFVQREAGSRYLVLNYEELMLKPANALDSLQSFANLDLSSVIQKIKDGEPFRQQTLVHANRLAKDKTLIFSQDRVKKNKLEDHSNSLFWFTFGWPSRFWGYHRRQTYL